MYYGGYFGGIFGAWTIAHTVDLGWFGCRGFLDVSHKP